MSSNNHDAEERIADLVKTYSEVAARLCEALEDYARKLEDAPTAAIVLPAVAHQIECTVKLVREGKRGCVPPTR
jgi:hypothetical protein